MSSTACVRRWRAPFVSTSARSDSTEKREDAAVVLSSAIVPRRRKTSVRKASRRNRLLIVDEDWLATAEAKLVVRVQTLIRSYHARIARRSRPTPCVCPDCYQTFSRNSPPAAYAVVVQRRWSAGICAACLPRPDLANAIFESLGDKLWRPQS